MRLPRILSSALAAWLGLVPALASAQTALQQPITTETPDTLPVAFGKLYSNDLFLQNLIATRFSALGPAALLSVGTITGTVADGGALAAEILRAQAAEQTNATAIQSNATAISNETSRAQGVELLKAPIASPAFTGAPTAPTAANGTNSNQIATTAFVLNNAGSGGGGGGTGGVPSTRLLTAAGLVQGGGDLTTDRTFTVPIAAQSDVAVGTDQTKALTSYSIAAALGAKAPLASPTFVGIPTAPTPPATDNGASIATTAFVQNAGAAYAPVGNASDPNAFDNSALDNWQRSLTPAAALSSPTGTRTFLADRVWVSPAGAAVTQQQSTSVPSGSKSLYSLQVNGAASVTTVNIGLQRVLARNVPRIKRTSALQVALYNGTGAAFTPSLILSTPSAADNYATTAVQLTQALQSCATATWCVENYTGDLSTLSNVSNGLSVEIQIPSGVLVAGKTVNVAEMDLRPGAALMPFERRDPSADLWRCRYHAQVLLMGVQAPAANTAGANFGFNPPMGGMPSYANLQTGISGNASIAQDGPQSQYGAFMQINATAAGGFYINRLNVYFWEP